MRLPSETPSGRGSVTSCSKCTTVWHRVARSSSPCSHSDAHRTPLGPLETPSRPPDPRVRARTRTGECSDPLYAPSRTPLRPLYAPSTPPLIPSTPPLLPSRPPLDPLIPVFALRPPLGPL
eukprot:792089-Prorocentrum_minimum.AAC.4